MSLLERLIRLVQAALQAVWAWTKRHSLGVTISLLVVAFLVAYFSDRIFISIYSGQAGVLWRRFGGTVTHPQGILSEGLHIILPINIVYKYNLRWQIVRRQVRVLTRDGLEIDADLVLLFRVKRHLVGELHQKAGPHYVDSLVIPALDAAARHILGSVDTENLYVNRSGEPLVESGLLTAARANIEENYTYLEVRDLNFRQLLLPERVQTAIQQKREEEQLALLYDYRLQKERKEAERKRTEAEGIRDFQDIISGGLSERYLKFKGIEATLELAKSQNTKVIVIGDKDGLPLILGPVPSELGR
jgi:regulator of protease activity HflC (stomatin/prohibitin superfamily)